MILAAAAVAGLFVSRRSEANERQAGAARGALSLTVSGAPTGRAIPSGFLGLSLEYPAVEAYAGNDPNAINPVFEQLIRNLTPGQAPDLRIGGDTTDWTWWPVPGVTKPRGIRYSIGNNFAAVTAALAHGLGARLILGVNLELDSKTDAATEAQALVAGVGADSIQALELGNEPELYGSFSFYKAANGHPVNGRPAGYDFSSYLPDFARIAKSLPDLPLAGPATGAPKWIPELAKFLRAEPRVTLATLHRYPLQLCFRPAASPAYPSVAHILAPSASESLADSVASLVSAAHSRNVPLRIDEMNSVSCGGAPGVSDAFVSALWVLDAVFQMARVGVDGVNIHTYPSAPYELFRFTHENGGWSGSVAPEYYGLLMFAQAAPAGSRLLRTSGTLGNVRAWATRATDGTEHVLLINDYTAQSPTVDVRIAGAHGAAALERLRAPGVHSLTGVTIGGQSFGTATDTGLLSGPSDETSVSATHGTYVVRLPPASAAMLTLGP
jgi:Glycosyl hydrolase family 79 C-terminal beta domain